MGKPPTTDEELTLRVAALEERADITDASIDDIWSHIHTLDARVTALEELVTTGEPPPAGAHPDHELPRPPVRPDHTLPEPEPQPPTAGRAVTILLDGASHVFTQEGGTDLGDYHDPRGRFVQHCIAATNPEFPDFTVFFRPDAGDGGREEVVFEFGRCHGNPAYVTLGAYTATITRDGETLATVEAPKHYYYSRWRWCSAPRPVTTTVADLLAAKLVPHFDKAMVSPAGKRAPGNGNDGTAVAYTGPMSMAGIYPYMGATGERNDIGIVTEWEADYCMYEDAQAEAYIRAQAEGAGSVPWHYRDENTGAPISFATYPDVGWYNPVLAHAPGGADIGPETGHSPDVSYVPFLLTGDPYMLEEMQFQATYDNAMQGTKHWGVHDALRSHAWTMRTLAHCIAATPAGDLPSWLQPRSYWEAYVAEALTWCLANGPNKGAGTYQQRFSHMAVALNSYTGDVACNMEDYTCAAYLHMADLGIAGWDAMRDWKIQDQIARTNGTSGYNRSLVNTYTRILTEGAGGPVLADWKALMEWNVSTNQYDDWRGYDETGTHMSPNANVDFANQTLACINWACRQGIAAAEPCHAWLNAEMAGKVTNLRWAIF